MHDLLAQHSLQILVIEDDPTTRLLLKRTLEREGYNITLAEDGVQGMDKALAISPALIISDWVMPELDGMELCRQVRSHPDLSGVFVILLSSRETVADRVQGLDAGADEFLSKPIDPNELRARVRAGLRQYQLNHQLKAANYDLMLTLQQLKQAQAQLIQSEKMSSLGQMVAGIAHEINNPINFIEGNLSFAQDYIQDLLNIIHLYQKYFPDVPEDLGMLLEDTDIDFLREDSKQLIDSMRVGAARIHQIINHLRNFSRLDEADMKRVDIHDGINSTLIMLQNRFRTGSGVEIEVYKHYGDLPKIDCYPGQLNQVFLNILHNAIYFLQEYVKSGNLKNPKIEISTRCIEEKETVEIIIWNNGLSIPEMLISKVFDPFFTTKPVGQGTGMGLSICYQIIVERHRGHIHCFTPPDGGTGFAIEIPRQQPEQNP
ncbi:MAG: response regulator [Phormidium sp. BM_Day4_Bin.17]|nr:response regulator [Phormidium sp. BM_Day4_Bin.17]UCJ13152.1 MAG: response regulator [Phormidium sp. PBR-2020]